MGLRISNHPFFGRVWFENSTNNKYTPDVKSRWLPSRCEGLHINTELTSQKHFEQMASHFSNDMSCEAEDSLT